MQSRRAPRPVALNAYDMEHMTVMFQAFQKAKRVPQAQGGEQHRLSLLKEFMKQKPMQFNGIHDPKIAERWLKDVKKKLNTFGIPQEFWIEFATYLFEELAEEWWDLQGAEHDIPNLTWDEFEEIFRRTYVPLSFRQGMIREFDRLEQRDMTVTQYHSKFIELSTYNPGAVADPIARCEKFRNSLRPKIKQLITSMPLTDFADLVVAAMEAEAKEWWDLQGAEHDIPNHTWDEFEEIFYRTYVPLSFRQGMIREFDMLEQRNMTVTQYHSRFIELSRYNPGAIADPIARCEKFRNALRPKIRQMIISTPSTDFADLVAAAMRAEAELNSVYGEYRGPGGGYRKITKKTKVHDHEPQSSEISGSSGSLDSGRFQSYSCHYCGQLGHKHIECPNRPMRSPLAAGGPHGNQIESASWSGNQRHTVPFQQQSASYASVPRPPGIESQYYFHPHPQDSRFQQPQGTIPLQQHSVNHIPFFSGGHVGSSSQSKGHASKRNERTQG